MLTISDIRIQYGDRILLNDISLVIKDRDKLGLVGRNGAGKSTLLKVIAKYKTPDTGHLSMPKEASVGFLHQELELPKGKTVLNETMTAFAEAIALQEKINELQLEISSRTDYESDDYMDLLQRFSDANDRFELLGGSNMEIAAIKVLKGLGFKDSDLSRLTDEFSGGWQMRVELAKILLQQPTYLLLDEPTNHLDIESILWLEDYLKSYPGAVILISHDKTFLDQVTNRTVEIQQGNLYDYQMPYTKYLTARAERREKLEAAFKNQQKVIAEKERTINRFMAKANKTKMAQSMKKQLDKMDRVELDEVNNSAMNIRFPNAPRSGEIVLKADDIVKRYDKIEVLQGVDFKIERGERIAFVGQNGQGKTTLSKILINKETATSGKIELGHNVQIGYYAQNQADTLALDKTVLATLEDLANEATRPKVRAILGAYMFSGKDVEKKVSVLSGGEKARLALACMMLEPFNLLVLDEPTNHLDIQSKNVLKKALDEYDGSLIVVSHDRDFLADLTHKTLEFKDHQLYEHLGDINYFLKKRALDNMREVEKPQNNNNNPSNAPKLEGKAYNDERRRLQKIVQTAERKIEKTEKEIASLEKTMAATDFFQSPSHQETITKYQQLKEKLDAVMEEWTKAQEEFENFV